MVTTMIDNLRAAVESDQEGQKEALEFLKAFRVSAHLKINDVVIREAKIRACREDKSLSDVVEDLLLKWLLDNPQLLRPSRG